MNVLVTGGAGFIGSHLTDKLMLKGYTVYVIDNLSGGSVKNIGRWLDHSNFNFIRGDLLNRADLSKLKGAELDVVFHLAADPDVRSSLYNPKNQIRNNFQATYNLLELVKDMGIRSFVFASSSTVYGNAKVVPTPEDYAPLKPISIYGATKLASEAIISSYAYNYGFNAVILRLANVVGPRSRRGVVFDFIKKLHRNPRELEILGDGHQKKSYIHVEDCVNAFLLASELNNGVEVYNVGSKDWITVREIAEIVIEEMGLENVNLRFTGGVNGAGWKGDVKEMLLDVNKLKEVGWSPQFNSREAVKKATRELLSELSENE